MDRRVLTLDEATCRRRTSLKWRRHPADVLPLWIAEMDTRPAPAVTEEIQRIARDGDLGYPMPHRYLEAVASSYARWGAHVDPSRMVPVTDVLTGMRAGVIAFTQPADPVYVTVPVYPPFHAIVEDLGRRRVEVRLDAAGRLDAEALERAFAEHGRGALLLANPHNPTGTVPTATELGDVARAALRHGVGVISDEVHAPLVLPGATFTPLLALAQAQSFLAVISAAKGWNLAGLKAAVLIGGTGAGATMSRLPRGLEHTTGHVAVRVHTVALEHGQDWLAEVVADLDANRTLLAGLLGEHLPGVLWRPVEATYLAWLDCRGLHLEADPAQHFLEVAKVALTPGTPFGSGAGHARLNFATSPGILTQAIERMAGSLTGRRG